MDIKVIPLFPVLVNYIELQDFSKYQSEMLTEINFFMQTQEGVVFSNRKGYQSPPNFYKKNKNFKKYITIFEKELSGIKSFYSNKSIKIDSAWFNVNFPGSYNVAHTHPTASLTAIWWLKIPLSSGDLLIESPHEFTQHKVIQNIDSRVKEQFNIYDCYKITPKEGTIIIFPSHLRHMVDENCSLENRVSIAFNLDFYDE